MQLRGGAESLSPLLVEGFVNVTWSSRYRESARPMTSNPGPEMEMFWLEGEAFDVAVAQSRGGLTDIGGGTWYLYSCQIKSYFETLKEETC
jgi:hypothetical protein